MLISYVQGPPGVVKLVNDYWSAFICRGAEKMWLSGRGNLKIRIQDTLHISTASDLKKFK